MTATRTFTLPICGLPPAFEFPSKKTFMKKIPKAFAKHTGTTHAAIPCIAIRETESSKMSLLRRG